MCTNPASLSTSTTCLSVCAGVLTKYRRVLVCDESSESSDEEADTPRARRAPATLPRHARGEGSGKGEMDDVCEDEVREGERRAGVNTARVGRVRYANQYCLDANQYCLDPSNAIAKAAPRRTSTVRSVGRVSVREGAGGGKKVQRERPRTCVGEGSLEVAAGDGDDEEGREGGKGVRRERGREARGRGGGMGSRHELEVLLRLASKRLSFA